MFKKLLSSFALMMLFLVSGASAQDMQIRKFDARLNPSFASNPITSVITPAEKEYWWGYWDGEMDDFIYLTGKGPNADIPQNYSACIRIPAGSPIGADKTIEGIRLTFPSHKNVSNLKIWMSEVLPSSPESATVCCQSVPDEGLTSMMAEADIMNEVRFQEPYKILSDKDVYVGYSFQVSSRDTQNDQYPIVIDMHSLTKEDAMFLKFGDKAEWQDFNGSKFGDLAIQILMSGDIQRNSVGINPTFDTVYGKKDSEVSIPVTFDNRGLDGFNTLDIVIDINGNKQTQVVDAGRHVRGIGEMFKFDLKLKTLPEPGTSEVTVTVDKVDGKPNVCDDAVMKGKVVTLTRNVQKKVLVEEMTAFWCGACPTGYVGLQKLRQQFGENIVLLSLHRRDDLECLDYLDYVLNTNEVGYPNSHLDRTYLNVYPYIGTGHNGRIGKAGYGGFGLGNDCLKLMETLPVAEVAVRADIEGDVLTATATTKFLYTGDANYALAFAVTEDGMHNEEWVQSNYLSDQKGLGWEDEEPLFDMWVNGNPKIADVVYDDIAIAARDVEHGIEGSIPAKVKEEEALEYSVDFNLGEYYVIQDRSKLNIVAFLIDKTTGRIVNADYKKVGDDTGIDNVGNDTEVYETARYTLDGRRITNAEKGVNIVKYSDGTVKKIVVE